MNLIKFRVTNFRSIADTGWIDASRVTALIGTNESGKSNILLALWKLKPVREGEIDLKADAPRKLYNQIRSNEQKPVFIRVDFELPDRVIQQLVKLTSATSDELRIARVSRSLDNRHFVEFPVAQGQPTIPITRVTELLSSTRGHIQQLDIAGKTEQPLKDAMLSALRVAETTLDDAPEDIPADVMGDIREVLVQPNLDQGLQKSVIVPAYRQFLSQIDGFVTVLSRPSPGSVKEAGELVWQSIPSFVYYANYGNLDSEIYLPHVIANLQRTDLGGVEAAKARTLRVLFEFVNLSPKEILDLGKDIEPIPNPTPEHLQQIHQIADKKKEREILLTHLTQQAE